VRDVVGRAGLLTGASAGLGPVIAHRLHREGVRLVLSARSRDRLDQLARELVGSRVLPADLSVSGEPERLAAAAGDVDILVAGAGLPASGPLTDFSVEHLDRALAVNLRAPVVLARLLLPGMIRRGRGHLVLIASLAGRVPAAKASVYDATKFGLRGFGHALRAELRGTGVGVSIVSPTFVRDAGMWADAGGHAPIAEVTPGQVAEAVLRAIRRDRPEIAVAPAPVRWGSRLVAAAPELVSSLARGAASFPDHVVTRQRAKR
jgi:short-subunit dehydrogenase